VTAARAGAALLAVLLALAITSALVVGGAYVTRQLAASARLSHRAVDVEPAAEAAIAAVILGLDSAGLASQPMGIPVQAGSSAIGQTVVKVWLTRVSATSYWLVAEATDARKPLLRLRLGVHARMAGGTLARLPERAWADLP